MFEDSRIVEFGSVERFRRDFFDALATDFNTPEALAAVHGVVNEFYKGNTHPDFAGFVCVCLHEMLGTLGLIVRKDEWSADILDLAKRREEARKAKDWAGSDKFRDELRKLGVLVEDTPEGPRLKKLH